MNPDYKYLSNDSKHGFIEDGKWWKTATHYIEAFRSTTRAKKEDLRILELPQQVRRRSRRIDKIEIKDNMICFEKMFHYKDQEIIKKAMLLKFYYNERILNKLVETYPIPIRGHNSFILSEIREQYINEKSISRLVDSNGNLKKNVIVDEICKLIRETIINLSIYVTKMEKWNQIVPEMTEDAIRILFKFKDENISDDEINKNIKDIRKFGESIKTQRNYFYIENCKTILIKDFNLQTEFPKQKDFEGISQKICDFLIWSIMTIKRYNDIKTKCQKFKIALMKYGDVKKIRPKIILPIGKRWYRSKPPPNMKIITVSQDELSNEQKENNIAKNDEFNENINSSEENINSSEENINSSEENINSSEENINNSEENNSENDETSKDDFEKSDASEMNEILEGLQ